MIQIRCFWGGEFGSKFDVGPTRPLWQLKGSGPITGSSEEDKVDEGSECSSQDEEEDVVTEHECSGKSDENTRRQSFACADSAAVKDPSGSKKIRGGARQHKRGGESKADWGGKVAIVLEMRVRSVESRMVRHMLHEIEEFGNIQACPCSRCIGALKMLPRLSTSVTCSCDSLETLDQQMRVFYSSYLKLHTMICILF